MNPKTLAVLFMLFGLLFTLAQCGRLTVRDQGDDDDDDNSAATDDGNDSNDDDQQEKRAILNFLENDDDASEFLDQSRRLFSGTKSHMKEAKEKYEEKCERTLHPRYCPDLATWDAWKTAYAKADKK